MSQACPRARLLRWCDGHTFLHESFLDVLIFSKVNDSFSVCYTLCMEGEGRGEEGRGGERRGGEGRGGEGRGGRRVGRRYCECT